MQKRSTLLRIIKSTFLLVVSISANAQEFEWVRQFEGDGGKSVRSVDVDNLGNFYSVGIFRDTVDFAPGNEIFNLISKGEYDIFISKLDASGEFEWAKQIASSYSDWGSSIKVDDSGNVYITGSSSGSVDLDPGERRYSRSSEGSVGFVLKLDASGNFLWAAHWGGWGNAAGRSLTMDGAGNIYVTGTFYGTIDFDHGDNNFELSSVDQYQEDIFIVKLDNSGNFLWAKQMGGKKIDDVNEIVADNLGNIYLTGNFDGSVDFYDPNGDIYGTDSASSKDFYIAKLNDSGNLIWLKYFGGSGSGNSIAIDKSGDLYIRGDYIGTVDFDPGPDIYELSLNGDFILKLDNSGNFLWVKRMGSYFYGGQEEKSICTDGYGNLYVTGDFSYTTDFDFSDNEFKMEAYSYGKTDAFILKLNTFGEFVWAKQLGGAENDKGNSIIVDKWNNIITAGTFENTANFNTDVNTYNLLSTGSADIFVVKMSQTATTTHDNFFDASITLYPNPTTGNLNIELGKIYSELNVSVKNISGQEVISEKFNEVSNFQISTNGLIPGVYFLQLTSQDGNSNVLKFIKN